MSEPTKEAQVAAWMAATPVIRQVINGNLVEITGEDRRVIFEATYDENFPLLEVARVGTQRASGRAALRAAWDGLPSWIRGPYRDKFEVANRLLDEGDDEAARDLIKYATPLPDSEETPLATFEAVRAQMMSGIDALPK